MRSRRRGFQYRGVQVRKLVLLAGVAMAGALAAGSAQAASFFTPGDLVVSVEGDGSGTGVYTDNQAAPLTLYEFSTTGTNQTAIKSLELPQTASGSNSAVSGEYGSSSEGILQLTGKGNALTIMGYGVNAATYNANAVTTYGNAALAQSTSVPGGTYTAVPRVVAVIGANGSVNSSTSIYDVFDQNNPRSVYSTDGTHFYISGQGTGKGNDTTAGVFYTTLGSHTATAITGQDATSSTGGTISQDTRVVEVVDGTLYVSADTKGGTGSARDFIGTLGSPPSTTLYNNASGPTQLNGFGTTKTGIITISGNGNGLNSGKQIDLSPDQFFFATPDVLYVADTGAPKNDKASSTLGDGGLQKWILNTTTHVWSLAYTLYKGLNLVDNNASKASDVAGTTGLASLTGEVLSDGDVELFTTNYTIGDTDPTFLYGITDVLADTTASEVSGEKFLELAAAPADTNFKGVSFAPVPEPETWGLLIAGLGMMGAMLRDKAARRRRAAMA